ncbi:MAG TPA: FAD-dependent oxidoreductase, partial [Candidatus Lustribacter sp.]|nr:FAD-dependent oxidoreductase [Candidatus Lustribacter sp.]
MAPFDVVVIGGGVSGLAAAWQLTRAGRALSICVYDAAPVPGGKLASGVVAGHRIDIGAESMLARRPEAVGLVEEAGLAGGLTHPDVTAASVYSRGRLWPLPPRTLMGIPSDPETTRGLLTDAEVARIYAEPAHPEPVSSDISVGDLVAGRLGTAVLDRLVEPLLAGVYAGSARRISAAASLPAFYAAAASGHGLVATAAELARASATDPRPVFAGYAGGLGLLAEHLAARLEAAGVEIRCGAHVEGLRPRPGGWSVSAISG